MSITLGTAPQKLNVLLTKDADFFTTLRSSDGDWPGTARIELRLGSIVWEAEITGTDAVISVDFVEVNKVYSSPIQQAKLFYIDGTTDICWGLGKVTRGV